MEKFEIDDKQYFIKTTPAVIAEAKKVHNKAFREALECGALLRKSLLNYMRDQGVWDDKKESQYQGYIKLIGDLEYKLASGKMKVSEGRALALELSKVRGEFRDLIAERNSMDVNTAEGQADNIRFNYLLSASVCSYDTQKSVYASLDEYNEKGSEALALRLAGKFANYLYGVDENYEKNLVENKFLKRFNMIDEEGRLIKDGGFVDVDGNPVDSEGYRIKDGKRVDSNGNEFGSIDVEKAEFNEG